MVARTIKQLVNAAQAELGLAPSTSIYSTSTDLTAIQMGALANRCLDELREMARWTVLQFEYNIVVSPATATTGNMAANSAVITGIPSTAAFAANFWAVSGAGIPQAARILSVDSATQVTMTMENTNDTAVTATDLLFAKDTYALPSDFDYYNNDTMWDRTNFWQLVGPDSPQRDQYLRSGITPLVPRRQWRQAGPYASRWRIWPPPNEIAAPLQLVFEYLSTNAVDVNGLGTSYASSFVNDTDTCLLNENALIMGLKWMFWEIKGFGSYVTLQNRWVDYVNRLNARDGGSPTLSMARREGSGLISPANIPDGNYPS